MVSGLQMLVHVAKLRSGDPARRMLFQRVKNVVLIDHGKRVQTGKKSESLSRAIKFSSKKCNDAAICCAYGNKLKNN